MAKNNDEINILLSESGNPSYSHSEGANSISTTNAAILGQLFKISPNFELVPNQVESYKWDEESKTYHLKLKNNLVFHNGRKVNSFDLEFSLLRGFFSQKRSFYEIYIGNIAGTENIKLGEKFKSGKVSGIKILSDLEISIKLKRDNPSFLHSLVNPFLALVPQEEFEEDLITWKKFPVGVGPYKVVNDFDGKKIKLERLDKTKKHIEFVNLYTTSDPKVSYDILAIMPDEFDSKNYTEYLSSLPIATAGFYFIFGNKLSDDINFRKAIHHGLNRKELIDGFPELSITYEMLPSQTWGRANLKDPYNPKMAKDYLRKVDSKLISGTIEGMVFGNKIIPKRSQLLIKRIEESLAAIGLKIKMIPSTEKFLSKESAKKIYFNFSGMVSEHIDPLIMFGAFRSNSAFEYFKPIGGDPHFDKLYLDAALAIQKEARVNSIQTMSSYLDKMSYFVPYAEKKMIYWIKKNRFKSLGMQTQSLFLSIDEIEVAQ
jgi:oligopeptide transport system substrate-binding protein